MSWESCRVSFLVSWPTSSGSVVRPLWHPPQPPNRNGGRPGALNLIGLRSLSCHEARDPRESEDLSGLPFASIFRSAGARGWIGSIQQMKLRSSKAGPSKPFKTHQLQRSSKDLNKDVPKEADQLGYVVFVLRDPLVHPLRYGDVMTPPKGPSTVPPSPGVDPWIPVELHMTTLRR